MSDSDGVVEDEDILGDGGAPSAPKIKEVMSRDSGNWPASGPKSCTKVRTSGRN